MELPKSTKDYYAEKAGKITQTYAKTLADDYENYEGFINIPFAKSMIRLKFNVNLDYKTAWGNPTTSMSDEDVFDMLVEESLHSLIYSGIIKSEINKTRDIYLTNQMPKSSAENIKEFLNTALRRENKNPYQQEIDKIRYMYIGDIHIRLMPHIIGVQENSTYQGEYEGIKIYLIPNLEDIYITSAPFIDLTTIDVRYNEYVKEKYDKKWNPDKEKMEEIKKEDKSAVVTLNCNLGDVKIFKLKTIYGNGKAYMRKLKLQRILKNEIDI